MSTARNIHEITKVLRHMGRLENEAILLEVFLFDIYKSEFLWLWKVEDIRLAHHWKMYWKCHIPSNPYDAAR